MAVNVVSQQDFEVEVLRSELPVLVDFFGEWCAPCKQMDPEIEALAAELDGQAKVVKVDIDRSAELASMLRIEAVPTYVVFHQGRPVGIERGAVPRARLRALLEPVLPRQAGAVRPGELASLLKQGLVVAIDTRDPGSFGRAHVPAAVNIPIEEIEGRLAEVHMAGSPVLYCRAGDKTKALSEKLAADGVELPFIEGGFLGWEAEMLPIERG